MVEAVLYALIVLLEVCSFDAFWGILFETKISKRLVRLSILFVLFLLASKFTIYLRIWKIPLFIIITILACRVFFKATWWQSIFFSGIGYLFLYISETMSLSIVQKAGVDIQSDYVAVSISGMMSILIYIICMLLIKRRYVKAPVVSYFTGKDWIPFTVVPLLSIVCIIFMYDEVINLQFKGNQSYIGLILFVANMATLLILFRMLQDKEALRQATVKENDIRKRLDYFHDMQTVFERQGKKLHDYKNQLLTIQELIKGGDTGRALQFTENLTESISVEMSAVNTSHPIVNAILNQKYRTARSLGIRMIFTVGDLSGIQLDEEEIVIILSNLLDNAIHECGKITAKGNKAAISVKAVYEDGQFELYVRNPVLEKIVINNGIVIRENKDGHGIGIANVRDVVERHDGSFALCCDDKEFIAAVII